MGAPRSRQCALVVEYLPVHSAPVLVVQVGTGREAGVGCGLTKSFLPPTDSSTACDDALCPARCAAEPHDQDFFHSRH